MPLDLNHHSGAVPGRADAPATPSVGDAINALIDEGLVAAEARQKRRDYLGASVLADPCARKLVYFCRGEEEEPHDGRALRIFGAGHAFEALVIDWLRRAGFDLRDTNPRTGRQYEFETAGGRIRGHCDGIIAAGPQIGARYPLLWECKSLNNKSWNDLVKKGLRQSKPVYYGQVQIYLAYLGLDAGLFTALNKDTCELYHQLVPFDRAEAQRLSDRAVDILRMADAGELPPRISADPGFFACRYCGHRAACWGDAV